MKKVLISLAIIASMILTQAAACSSKTKKAAEISYQFSGLVLDLAKATDRAFTEGAITLAQKDSAVVVVRKMNAGAKAFNTIVTEIANMPEIPPDKLALLNKILSSEIIDPFLQLVGSLGAAAQIDALRPVISAIRIAILTISSALGEYTAVDKRRIYA